MKFIKYILFLIGIIHSTAIFAQVTPCFTSVNSRGCAPFILKLKDCSGGTSKFYAITSANGFTYAGFDSTITLPTAGIYSVTQRAGTGNINGTTPSAPQTIEVLDAVQPNFDIQICEGRSIKLTTPASPYEQYIINWNDGSPIETVSASVTRDHIYTSETSKIISVNGNFMPGGCGNSRSATVIPFQALNKPEVKTIVTGNNTVTLSFEAEPQFQYRILENQGSGNTVIKEIKYQSGLQTLELAPNTESNTIYYQIEAFDDCGNTLGSEIINTITPSFINGNKQIEISIPPAQTGAFDEIKIYRNNEFLQSVSSSSFTDLDIECGIDYCYTIEAIKGNSISKTIEYCMTGQSNTIPDKVNDLYSTFIGEDIQLSWTNASIPVKNYTIYTTTHDNSIPEIIDSTIQNQYIISDVNLNIPSCFVTTITDLCSNTSLFSTKNCPIYLTVNKEPNTNILIWNFYSGNTSTVEYKILKYDSEMNLLEEIVIQNMNSYTDPVSEEGGSYFYQIEGFNNSGFTTKSNIVEAKNEMIVIIPTAFSPNGDMVNDEFLVKGKFIKSIKMSIFNNWGELIFSSSNIQDGWNGNDYATAQPSGTYAYIIEVTDFKNNAIIKTGTVTLVR